MATDPVTSPITRAGKWVYGVLIGVTIVLIRNFTGYVEGVTFAILFGNIVAPILDEAAIKGIKLWKFLPAKKNSTPILSLARIPITFNRRELK